jgi:hypothetical protein
VDEERSKTRSEDRMTNSVPVDLLESRAAEQRRQLHQSVENLRGAVREKLDLQSHAREYVVPAMGIMATIGLAIGYGISGVFFRRH